MFLEKNVAHDERLGNNSYAYHSQNSGERWGGKAADVLMKVKGDRFRHEKTKKKRATYSGGSLTTGVHSIKLASSASEEDF